MTQFPADNNGKLIAIRRKYVQDGKIIANAEVTKEGFPVQDFMNDEYCAANPGGTRRFMELGALEQMGEALSRGMVLAFAVWWDVGGFMDWMDGVASGAGPCNATEGNPDVIRQIQPDTAVKFSKLKWGEIGSTF